MSKIGKLSLSFAVSFFSLIVSTNAQAWMPVDSDAEHGSVSLAQYINNNPYGLVAKIAHISICFNKSAGAPACKDTANGVDQNIFSATLTHFDEATSTAQFHLQASRIFVFGNDTYSYSGDVLVNSGFVINGCAFALQGTPVFTFSNEEASTMPPTYINVFHQQLTGQATEIINTFLGGYNSLPGFMSGCQ